MQITIDLPDEIAQHLTQSIADLPRRTLESLVAQCHGKERSRGRLESCCS